MTTVQFVILEGLEPVFEPETAEIPFTHAGIQKFIRSRIGRIYDYVGAEVAPAVESLQDDMAALILAQKYCVLNNILDRFVIAFAVDWTQFNVESLGYAPALITWHYDK